MTDNVIWPNETKMEILVIIHSTTSNPNAAYQHRHLIPTVKHGGGRLMIWACFVATGPGHPVVVDSTMNSSV